MRAGRPPKICALAAGGSAPLIVGGFKFHYAGLSKSPPRTKEHDTGTLISDSHRRAVRITNTCREKKTEVPYHVWIADRKALPEPSTVRGIR